jgi:hypothetical protein
MKRRCGERRDASRLYEHPEPGLNIYSLNPF